MRLKQYLIEGRSKTISRDKAIDILHSKCKKAVKAYKNGNAIYRGMDDAGDFAQVSSSKFTRESANTDNYYTLINDNSPAWAKYPKRSKSIICTTNFESAQRYGTLYAVFPFDNAKIGVCSNYDYWWSFPFFSKYADGDDLTSYNYTIKSLLINIDPDVAKRNLTYKKLSSIMTKFDKYTQFKNEEMINDAKETHNMTGIKPKTSKYPYTDMLVDMYPMMKDYAKFNSLEEYSRYLLDPKKNKFELKTIGDKLPKNKEVWTDGDSILIKALIAMRVLS